MSESTEQVELMARPPEAEFCPVGAEFLAGVDYLGDPKYLAIAGSMDAVEIEFTKALVLCDGVQSRAGRMIFPELSPTAQRKRGERLGSKPEVRALHKYFLGAKDNVSDAPVSREEFVRDIRKRWRGAQQGTAEYIKLSEMVMSLEGLNRVEKGKDISGIDEALLLADECFEATQGGEEERGRVGKGDFGLRNADCGLGDGEAVLGQGDLLAVGETARGQAGSVGMV